MERQWDGRLDEKEVKNYDAVITNPHSLVSEWRNASAITDYIHDRIRRVIYFIDQEKLNQWLMDQGESTRYLVKEIASIAASQRGSLANFFEEHNLSPHDFSQAILPLAFPDSITFRNWSLLLPTLTGRRPYIPGSSIKGAIRTALMFDYIKKQNNGRLGYGATPISPIRLVSSTMVQIFFVYLVIGLSIFLKMMPSFLQVTDTSPSPRITSGIRFRTKRRLKKCNSHPSFRILSRH